MLKKVPGAAAEPVGPLCPQMGAGPRAARSTPYNRADVDGPARSDSSTYPPGPRGYPILGVLPHLRSDPIRTFLDAADRFGDLVHLKAGPYHGFLACDPVTFARDASRLIASGWRLASLDLLDLFPNTHHVETLASFERASKS